MTSVESDTKPLLVTTYACRLRNNLRRYKAKYEAKENNNDPSIWRKRRGYQCDICGHKFHASINLKQHKLAHNGEKLYNCHLCSFSSSMKPLLEAHIEKHAFLRKFFCDLCDYSCIDPAGLAQHSRTHGIDRPYKCGICNYATDSHFRLEDHCTIHTQEKPYKCESCHHSFHTRSRLSSHRAVHNPTSKFKCNLCDNEGASRKLLASHARTHTGEKPYNCKLCGKNFAGLSGLSSHVRTHTGEKPYACPWCKFLTAHHSSLCRHTRNVHKRSLPPLSRPNGRGVSSKPASERRRNIGNYVHNSEPRRDIRDGTGPENDFVNNSLEGSATDSESGMTTISTRAKYEAKRRDFEVTGPSTGTVTGNPVGKAKICSPSFQCDYCEMRLDSAMKLLDHMRHHTGQKLYKCDVSGCDFKSGVLNKYKIHQNIHVSE